MTDPEIPGFKITREIGSGPRGFVYEASDGRRTLALKVFLPDAPVDPALLERFLKTSPDRIRHPNLLPLESVGRTADGRLYVSMPLLVGDSLETILKELRRGSTSRPSLSPLAVGPAGAMHPRLAWRAAELFAGAAEGLGAAHRRGAIHGRICARNLHLSPAGRLIVSDFGSEGVAEVTDATTDVCALASLLYQVLTHRSPFEQESQDDSRGGASGGDARLSGNGSDGESQAVIPPHRSAGEIPVELEACILKALESDPRDRYQDAGQLADDLRRFLRHEKPLAIARMPSAAPNGLAESNSGAGGAPLAIDPSRSEDARFSRPLWKSVLRRAAAALVLALGLAAAYLGGQRIRSEQAARQQGEAVVSLVQRGDFDWALAETRRLESLDPGSAATRILSDYASAAGALSSLGRAVDALGELRLPERSIRAISDASIFRPDDSQLRTLVRRLEEQRDEDALARDLRDPRAWARCAALRRLAAEIIAGVRPRDDARLALRAVEPSAPNVTQCALEALDLLEASLPILEAFHIGKGESPVSLDGDTFYLLCGVLERKLDPVSRELFCSWEAEAFERLDLAPRPVAISLPPNIGVQLQEEAQAGFLGLWVRVMARIDPQSLLARVPQLAASEHVIAELVDALESVGSREAQCALAEIARSHYLTAGHKALRSLAELGAYPELLEIVQGELPRPFREIALGLVGESFGVACLDELEALSVRSPEPSIRKIAFHHLSTQDERTTRPTILSAMDDPELRPMALRWLHRLPPEEAAPFCVRLLEHQDGAVRGHATALLAALAKGSDTLALAYQLLSKNPDAREATLAVLMWRNELSGLPLALEIALGLPEPLPYPGALLFPERTIATWWLLPESVAVPLRKALRHVRTAWGRAVTPVVQSLDL